MFDKFTEIGKLFKLNGHIVNYIQLTDGNINKTYRVFYSYRGKKKSYIFQLVNINVFKDPIGVMRNIEYVTRYIREEFPDQISLHYHHSVYGDNYIIYMGEFWRVMCDFDSITLNICKTYREVRHIGEAFGEFQRKLVNFDSSCLVESIKDFHNTKVRIDKLIADAGDKKMPEVEYIKSVREKASKISIMFNEGNLPSRPCHNDTKANNVLLHKITHNPLVIIDLDTLMPGTGLNDFADGARFICSSAKEDEADLSKVRIDLKKFRAFSKGFISRVSGVWEPIEIENIVLSLFSITIELASRFLDDYLLGNVYFKIDYPEHNLVRARCQIQLAKSIEENWSKLQAIVDKIVK